MQDGILCSRIGGLDGWNVTKKPGPTLFNGNTEPGFRLGITGIQDVAEFPSEGPKALVVKVTDKNSRGQIVCWIGLESLAVAPEKARKLTKQNAFG